MADTRIDVHINDIFLSEVNKRNTRSDGKVLDKGLIERLKHPICQKCHEGYKEKFPNTPFNIKCKGIYADKDFTEKYNQALEKYSEDDSITLDDIRGIYDPVYWASKNIVVKDDDGDVVPFIARWYQEETLSCTARNKVDRWGRGLGKTVCGVIEELHKALNSKNLDILIVCPADSQSEKWYMEIDFQVHNSPTMENIVAQQKQQPFKFFRFNNGSTISIFTAGSASGRGANSLRSQDPRRVRLDEQDYLNQNDYKAIDPLITRHKNSEFHGSSTPTGDRGKFWEICTKFPNYKEFYFPISVHPDWNEEMEIECRRQAKTDDVYRHEYLAEFSDPTSGVFKSMHIDAARERYAHPTMLSLKGYDCCRYEPSKRYFMGIDWNGQGTGTRIRVLSYDPSTKIRMCVAKATVDTPGATTSDSIQAIIELNKTWHCEEVYIDAGFGFVQDELIRVAGKEGKDPDTKRLQDVKVIDFGALLKSNRLVPKRDEQKLTRYLPDPKDEELERKTKPFMVEGAVIAFEHRLVKFSDIDDLLEEQLRSYRIKNYSSHGYANTYETDGNCGDHDLDAFMLALLAIEQKYGLIATKESYRRLAKFTYSSGWGVPTTVVQDDPRQARSPIEKRMERAGIPSRTAPEGQNDQYRLVYLMKHGLTRPGGILAPIRRNGIDAPKAGARTSIFKKGPKPRSQF